MIKATSSMVEVEGRRGDLQCEFMAIVKTFRDKGIFASDKDLLDSVNFALLDKEAMRKELADRMTIDLLQDLLRDLFNEEDI